MDKQKPHQPDISPPAWANRFLEWYCASDLLDEIQGDLHEAFYARKEKYSIRKARWLFIKEVLLFCKPSSFKKSDSTFNLINMSGMFNNYLKIAWRNTLKNKTFSAINIFGLAIGLAACFLILQYVRFELSYDKFHEKIERIYRIPITYSGGFANNATTASNHPAVAPAMKADFPEVENFTRLVGLSNFMEASSMSYIDENEKVKTFNEEKIYIADPSFFSVFSFPMISGQPEEALTSPNSIVITESTSIKYFGQEDGLGKVLHLNGQMPFKVTGVIKDVPQNSHMQFDMLVSFPTIGENWGYDNWRWPEFYNYVLLTPGAKPENVEAKFPAFTEKYLGDIMRELKFGSEFHLQPVKDIHLKSDYGKELEANGSEKSILFLAIIGAFILLIAWINFVNLSTAKSLERAKEVGLRKVVGATRPQLIKQFLCESGIINLCALLLAAIFVVCFFPYFSQFTGRNASEVFLSTEVWQEPLIWVILGGIIIAGALVVGGYPALALSSFQPALVLKGKFSHSSFGISLRRILVAFQFILSIALMIGTVTVYQQLSYMQNKDLGYNKDQILVVKTPAIYDSTIASKTEYFRTELQTSLAFEDVSFTSDVPGKPILWRNSVRKASDEKSFNFISYLMAIDENFINTFEVDLVAGRNFREKENAWGEENAKVIINEQVVKALGYKNNEEALNQNIMFALGQGEIKAEVIGVAKNYHQRSLQHKYDPILYFSPGWDVWKYFSIKINPRQIHEQIASVENLYEDAFPGNTFEYFFLDEFFARQYEADQQFGKVFSLFTGLAIIVACLGLFGLSAYMIKQRTREIGIRKVLGATIPGILALLSKDFVKLIIIASVIALPLSYFAIRKWLTNYAFHIDISVWLFLLPVILVLIIALATVSFQSIKAALVDPVKTLRQE